MKELKATELAKALEIKVSTINVNFKRGNLFRNENKKFDIEHPINKVWIENQKAKGKIFSIDRIYSNESDNNTSPKEQGPKNDNKPIKNIQINALALRKEKAATLLKEKEAEKRSLDVAKMLGALIPFDLVKSMNIYTIETLRTTFLQFTNNIANIYVQKLDGSDKDLVEIKEKIDIEIIRLMDEGLKNLSAGTEAIVTEWSENQKDKKEHVE